MRSNTGWTWILVALLGLAASVVAQEPQRTSSSKLSLHLIGDYRPGARQVVAAGPRLLKILDLQASMVEAMRDYKARYPSGVVVLRIYTPIQYQLAHDPIVSANAYWDQVLWPPLSALSAADRALIDYLEGPNEADTPTFESALHTSWFNQFWLRLIQRMQSQGMKPCLGSIAVGNPPGDPSTLTATLQPLIPALRAARDAGGSWSYHAYVLNKDAIGYTQNVAAENWTSLKYRWIRDAITANDSTLASMPIVLSEGGVDQSGDPNASGWQARGTTAEYQNWLKWFDRQLRVDSTVVGVTLFQSGAPWGWFSFETEPINPWLAGYLRTSRTYR